MNKRIKKKQFKKLPLINNFLFNCSFCAQPKENISFIIGPEVSICFDCIDLCFNLKNSSLKEEKKSLEEK